MEGLVILTGSPDAYNKFTDHTISLTGSTRHGKLCQSTNITDLPLQRPLEVNSSEITHSVVESGYSSIKETVVNSVFSSKNTDITRCVEARKRILSERRETDSFVKTFNEVCSCNSTKYNRPSLQRSLSNPGKGNLPFLDILGHSVEIPLFRDTENERGGIRHFQESSIGNTKIDKSFDDISNVTVDNDISYSSFTSHKSDRSFAQIKTQSDTTLETKVGDNQRPISDVLHLESEINYTHSDVDFLLSVKDDDLFADPGEILYAQPVIKDRISDQDSLNQRKNSDTSLVDTKSSNDIESDSELCKYVEELNKETDFRTSEVSPPFQQEEEAAITKSRNKSDEVDINFEDNFEDNSVDFLQGNLETFESDLNDAIEKSLNSNTMTPMIKRELQYKIQVQRLERGEEELQAEFNEPRTYQLTDVEIQKRNARREQNRRSAKKGRVKAKKRERELTKILNKASTSIANLTRQAKELKAEKSRLLQELEEHCGVCPKTTLVENQKKIIASLVL